MLPLTNGLGSGMTQYAIAQNTNKLFEFQDQAFLFGIISCLSPLRWLFILDHTIHDRRTFSHSKPLIRIASSLPNYCKSDQLDKKPQSTDGSSNAAPGEIRREPGILHPDGTAANTHLRRRRHLVLRKAGRRQSRPGSLLIGLLRRALFLHQIPALPRRVHKIPGVQMSSAGARRRFRRWDCDLQTPWPTMEHLAVSGCCHGHYLARNADTRRRLCHAV